MTPIHIYILVLLGVGFHEKTIAVRHSVKENENIPNLKAFARLGDPCERLTLQPNPDAQSKANDQCISTIHEYALLPRGRRTLCKDPYVYYQSGCKDPSQTGHWYCSVAFPKKDPVSLSYCIQNLDLGYSKWLQRSLAQRSEAEEMANMLVDPESLITTVTVTLPRGVKKEEYLKHFRSFIGYVKKPVGQPEEAAVKVEGKDPCASLEEIPDRAAIQEADRLCGEVITDFEGLKPEAQERCQKIQKRECKREPFPSKKWCCGLETKVKRGIPGCFLPRKRGTVCFSYCWRNMALRILA